VSQPAPSSAAPDAFPLKRGRGAVALHASGLRHPGHLFQREVFTPYDEVTHLVLLGRSLRIGGRRSVYVLPRGAFRDPEAPEKLLRALVGRIAAEPGGLVQLSRMGELDRRARQPGRVRVAPLLALVCIAAFVLERWIGPDVTLAGFFSRTLALAGEPWRLLTANLLHAGPLHLGMNLVVLLAFGALVERAIGTGRTFFVVVLAALGGMGAGLLAGYEDAVGASGIAAGLVGALLFLELRRADWLPATWRIPRRILVAALVGEAFVGALVPWVAGLAHLGGFVAGLAACAAVAPGALQRERAPGWLRAANAVLAVAVLLSLGAAGREVAGVGDVLARRGERLLEMRGVTPDLLNNTAWLLATSRSPTPAQLDVAVRLAERAVEETGRTDPNVLDTLAEAQFMAGQVEEALDTIDEAIELAPQEPYFVEQRRRFTGERASDDRPPPPSETPRVRPERPREPSPDEPDLGPDEGDEENPVISI